MASAPFAALGSSALLPASTPTCSLFRGNTAAEPPSPDSFLLGDVVGQRSGVAVPTSTVLRAVVPLTQRRAQDEAAARGKPIVVIGGGVSGVYAALTLVERGYTNVTIIEKEQRIGGQAASFDYMGQSYPLGAVGTPLALESASFSETAVSALARRQSAPRLTSAARGHPSRPTRALITRGRPGRAALRAPSALRRLAPRAHGPSAPGAERE